MANLVPAQPSFDWPPPATQAAVLNESQVKVTDFPRVIEDGAADKVTLGRVTAAVTLAVAFTPCATQFNPYW